MAIQSDTDLKLYFETGDTPTEAQFIDLIDSKLLKTGASAVKVNTISEETTNNGVKIETVKFQDNLIAQGSLQTEGYVMRKYDIGAWNAYTTGGGTATSTKTVVLDGALKNPESVNVVIINDSGSARSLPTKWFIDGNGDVVISNNVTGATNSLDEPQYAGVIVNRGHVVVTKWTTLAV